MKGIWEIVSIVIGAAMLPFMFSPTPTYKPIVLSIIVVLVLLAIWRRHSLLSQQGDETTRRTSVKEDTVTAAPDQGIDAIKQSIADATPELIPAFIQKKPVLLVTPKAEATTLRTPQRENESNIGLRDCAAPEGQDFIMISGERLRTLGDLVAIMPRLDEKQFSHHVNMEKNDFRNWIEHSLHLPKIALAIATITTRDEMANTLVAATT